MSNLQVLTTGPWEPLAMRPMEPQAGSHAAELSPSGGVSVATSILSFGQRVFAQGDELSTTRLQTKEMRCRPGRGSL